MSNANYVALAVMVVLTILYVIRRRGRIRREDRD
jgi:hypothetical protein